MSGWILFLIDLTVSSICLAGLAFTVVEMRRLGREADVRTPSPAGGPEGGSARADGSRSLPIQRV